MVLHVPGERACWDGGLLTPNRWLALHYRYGAQAANEFQAGDATRGGHAPDYARLPVVLADWEISAVTGAASNLRRLQFALPPAEVEWPGALSIGLWSAAAGGDLLVDENIVGAPLVGTRADPVAFEIGQLIFDV